MKTFSKITYVFDPGKCFHLVRWGVGSMRKGKILFCVLLMTVGSPILFSCSLRWLAKPSWESPRVVSVEGAEGGVSWSQGIGLLYLPVKSKQATHLLVRGGDLLSVCNGGFFAYLDSDGPVLSVKCNEYRTELNGKTVSIMLEKA